MREVLAAVKNGHERATLALEIYVHRLAAGIGAMIAVLGGIDALVFTAGVGEHSPEVRAGACETLEHVGVKLDPKKNAESPPDQDISDRTSPVRVLLIRAGEEWEIARDCWTLLQ
jgi:acetate kinase